jgi:tryptophan synthase beta chain
VGGGSNAMGLFYPFLGDEEVKMTGVEAAGAGVDKGLHAATISAGSVGVLHGSKTYLLQDENGQVQGTHSIAPGLDYPGVGPEHSYLNDSGRVSYTNVTDGEALEGFKFISEVEGIIPALESSHAIAYVMKTAPEMSKDSIIVICLSGRGDKDLNAVVDLLQNDIHQ